MQRKPLLWQLFPSYLLIMVFSLGAVAWYASRALPGLYVQQKRENLEAIARVIDAQIHTAYEVGDFSQVDALCKQLGRSGNTRITVILPSGRVVGDTQEDPERMDNHGDRPEVLQVLQGRPVGVETRFSKTLGQRMMYVAIPMKKGDDTVGVLRTAIAASSIERALADIYVRIAMAGIVIAVAAAFMSFVVARRISRPLEEMRRGAERFAKGDFTRQLPGGTWLEIDALAGAMNQMARELDERIRTIVRGRNEQQAVLASMVESVVAVDTDCRCISINQAAARLLGVTPDRAQGKDLHAIINNLNLQRFVERALESDEPIEELIVLHETAEECYLHAHGTALRDGHRKRIGAVVVMNDITRLRRLERVRKDFVANVSHELKTPITSIKGFVETLLDGAMNDPEDARRFLDIIARQAGRLNAIINDLLTLSKLEQQSETMEISVKRENIRGTIDAAVGLCEIKSTEKGVAIDVDCDPTLTAEVNDPLLEQALVNLIDNAIKYSESGSRVQVSAARVDDEIQISVRDHGCGIEQKHLPRLFERFYRVDKARSRNLGGTGLGLAIVKHICQVHRGRVTAESSPGKGSTFTIHLPVT
jgi:two-component system phosphate regulon sensor histidine kinase PhoR